MIPVKQTKLTDSEGNVHGNCFRACVASILDIEDIEEVPPFEDLGKDWYLALWEFLTERGYECDGCGDFEKWKNFEGVDGYYIVGGRSPREWVTKGHAVVYYRGELAHDPHPSNEGLVTEYEIYSITRKTDKNE